MKVAKTKTSVQLSNVDTKGFELVFDRHMVNILSNQLYERKVEAIVRELSTNGLDSQREAGCGDKPFEVHIPTWDCMEYSIRDFGTGMSPKKIDDIYRKYGASDRKDSNDFTGCMGLGSKTPFCYHTKSFTVDSWHNGMHRQYACFLDEDGMPQISDPLVEEQSDEPSGVKISLPVKDRDRYEFEQAAQKVYRFFKVTPKMTGQNVKINKPDYQLKGDNWMLDEDEYYGMHIIMGDVAYSVDENSLGDLTSVQRRVVNGGFHVYVDIGEVSPTASREGLDYTNRTKTHVRKYINDIITDFNTKAQEEIDNADDLWSARVKFCEYEKDNYKGIFDSSQITYDGKPLLENDGQIYFTDMIRKEEISLSLFPYSSWRKAKRSQISSIRPDSVHLWFENDLKTGAFVRATTVVENECKPVIIISFHTDDAKEKFLEHIGMKDDSYLTKISTIPSPNIGNGRSGGGKRGKTSRVVKLVTDTRSDAKSYYWKNHTIDFSQGGIYVEFNRYDWIKAGRRVHVQHLAKRVRLLSKCDLEIPDVIGIKTADITKYRKDPNWINFEDWAKEQAESVIAEREFWNAEFYRKQLDKLGKQYYYDTDKLDLSMLLTLADKCTTDNDLTAFAKKVKEVQQASKDWKEELELRNLASTFDIELEIPVPTSTGLAKMEEQLYLTYPLLKFFQGNKMAENDLACIVNYLEYVS